MVRISAFRSNEQQLALNLGASMMSWRVAGTRTQYDVALTHDIAAGRFALCTSATMYGGSASRGTFFGLQPQFQVVKELAVFISSGITLFDADGMAISRTSIPLHLGGDATLYRGPLVMVDVSATYTFTNPFRVGDAPGRTGFGGTARLVF